MNNKGFAITSIVYGLMLLFVMVVASFLTVLVGRNRRMDDLMEGVYESLAYPEININYDTTDNKFFYDKNTNETYDESDDKKYDDIGGFVTEQRAIYDFTSIASGCKKYLPKNIVILYAKYFDSSLDGLYYNTTGGDFSEENYTKLCS